MRITTSRLPLVALALSLAQLGSLPRPVHTMPQSGTQHAPTGTTGTATAGTSDTAAGSRAPALAPQAFVPLPVGSITPRGWLLEQLKLQAEGLSGHLAMFYPSIADSWWVFVFLEMFVRARANPPALFSGCSAR